ncbi:hypothetical protein CEXT_705821 [Caerostris extrusa]|uniref:Uncharacterized protein n=1 Tax=Caerostris extrusa TaxID=172846 RepID=A0AAV4XCF3_CAEEX|nr:hypothetical protein CEXT_705821 [Caerostris extrusa]
MYGMRGIDLSAYFGSSLVYSPSHTVRINLVKGILFFGYGEEGRILRGRYWSGCNNVTSSHLVWSKCPGEKHNLYGKNCNCKSLAESICSK